MLSLGSKWRRAQHTGSIAHGHTLSRRASPVELLLEQSLSPRQERGRSNLFGRSSWFCIECRVDPQGHIFWESRQITELRRMSPPKAWSSSNHTFRSTPALPSSKNPRRFLLCIHKTSSYIQKNTHNTINALKITIYNTKHTNNTKVHFNTSNIC